MRAAAAVFLAPLATAACVKGAPTQEDRIDAEDGDEFINVGGTTEVPGCGYSVTTRYGAEAPKLGTQVIGTDPTPFHVHLGIAGDAKTSIVIQWRTRDEATKASTVRYAAGDELPAAALTETLEGLQFRYETPGLVTPRIHEAHLCGLTADTIYSYQVGSSVDGTETWSPVYTFRTAPDVTATPDAEVRFAVVGDSRDGYDVWQQLAEQIRTRTPDLVLFSGDAVTVGLEQREWETFFDRAEPLFARVPVISAHGNHDVNSVNYYSQFALPGDEEDFGLDYGWAHLTVLNDTPDGIGQLAGETKEKLRADLIANADARWKLVLHHRPPWSASTNHGTEDTLQREWTPLYDEYGVDLVLNGHDHDYEVTKPLRWDVAGQVGQVVADNSQGTVYIVSGGAGAELYGNGSDFWTEYSESTHGAGMVTVRRDQMTFEAFRPDGSPIATGYNETKE
jgi:acid phosphatase type 7